MTLGADVKVRSNCIEENEMCASCDYVWSLARTDGNDSVW